MSYVRVDSSVPRNRKFQQAGPAPSWLWLCGLAYCQEGLTDGFIPVESIDYLGVKNARRLAKHLVDAGLWDIADGGWQVHDYLEHNKSAREVNGIKEERRKQGQKGGIASGHSRRSTDTKQPIEANTEANTEANAKQTAKRSANPYVDVDASASVDAASKEGVSGETDAPFDVWWLELTQRYPQNRVQTGRIVHDAFLEQFQKDTRKAVVVWADMCTGLENQKAGHEWRVKGMVPKLQRWLEEGLWRQRHDENPVSERVSEKTSRSMTSAAEFIKEGRRGA